MKVLLHYRAGPGLAERLAALPGLDLAIVSDADDAAFAKALPGAEVL
ncbi:MAG: hypothetical protein JWR00_2248, partial [Rubritepida sp.]|nr:hypothetical protein [Rubritepida sp.]